MVIPIIVYFTLPILIGVLLMEKLLSYKNFNSIYQIVFLCLIMVSLFLNFEITSNWDFNDYVLMIFVPLVISYLSGLVFMYVKNKR